MIFVTTRIRHVLHRRFASSCMACRSPGCAGSPYRQSVIPYGSPYHVIALRTVPGNQLHRTSYLSFHRTKRHTARMPHQCSSVLDASQAGLLGYTTENVTMWTSQTIGGLLNATLGNMVEVGLKSHPFLFVQGLPSLIEVALIQILDV